MADRDWVLTKEEIDAALEARHSRTVQERLRAGKVAVAGLGGLGSNVAVSLARIGVGHLHLIDFDRVDVTNLNRQQYFMRQIGRYKTDALKEELLEINPYLDIRTDCVRVTEENLETSAPPAWRGTGKATRSAPGRSGKISISAGTGSVILEMAWG